MVSSVGSGDSGSRGAGGADEGAKAPPTKKQRVDTAKADAGTKGSDTGGRKEPGKSDGRAFQEAGQALIKQRGQAAPSPAMPFAATQAARGAAGVPREIIIGQGDSAQSAAHDPSGSRGQGQNSGPEGSADQPGHRRDQSGMSIGPTGSLGSIHGGGSGGSVGGLSALVGPLGPPPAADAGSEHTFDPAVMKTMHGDASSSSSSGQTVGAPVVIHAAGPAENAGPVDKSDNASYHTLGSADMHALGQELAAFDPANEARSVHSEPEVQIVAPPPDRRQAAVEESIPRIPRSKRPRGAAAVANINGPFATELKKLWLQNPLLSNKEVKELAIRRGLEEKFQVQINLTTLNTLNSKDRDFRNLFLQVARMPEAMREAHIQAAYGAQPERRSAPAPAQQPQPQPQPQPQAGSGQAFAHPPQLQPQPQPQPLAQAAQVFEQATQQAAHQPTSTRPIAAYLPPAEEAARVAAEIMARTTRRQTVPEVAPPAKETAKASAKRQTTETSQSSTDPAPKKKARTSASKTSAGQSKWPSGAAAVKDLNGPLAMAIKKLWLQDPHKSGTKLVPIAKAMGLEEQFKAKINRGTFTHIQGKDRTFRGQLVLAMAGRAPKSESVDAPRQQQAAPQQAAPQQASPQQAAPQPIAPKPQPRHTQQAPQDADLRARKQTQARQEVSESKLSKKDWPSGANSVADLKGPLAVELKKLWLANPLLKNLELVSKARQEGLEEKFQSRISGRTLAHLLNYDKEFSRALERLFSSIQLTGQLPPSARQSGPTQQPQPAPQPQPAKAPEPASQQPAPPPRPVQQQAAPAPEPAAMNRPQTRGHSSITDWRGPFEVVANLDGPEARELKAFWLENRDLNVNQLVYNLRKTGFESRYSAAVDRNTFAAVRKGDANFRAELTAHHLASFQRNADPGAQATQTPQAERKPAPQTDAQQQPQNAPGGQAAKKISASRMATFPWLADTTAKADPRAYDLAGAIRESRASLPSEYLNSKPSEAQNRALPAGYHWEDVEHDGNCLYHSLAFALPNRGTHAEVRQQVADFLKQPGRSQTELAELFPEGNAREVIAAISEPGEYTGAAEDAVSYAARALNVGIQVVENDGSILNINFDPQTTAPNVVLGRADDHFFLLMQNKS